MSVDQKMTPAEMGFVTWTCTWNRALSADEISDLYENAARTGLMRVSYWQPGCVSFTGDTFPDVSKYQNHCIVTGQQKEGES